MLLCFNMAFLRQVTVVVGKVVIAFKCHIA